MSETVTVGLDLAKSVFQVHGADGARNCAAHRCFRSFRIYDLI